MSAADMPAGLYPSWDEPDDFDGPDDYYDACLYAEAAYRAEHGGR